RLGRLVGDVGIGCDDGHRGDVDDGAALLLPHDRNDMLGGEDAALQVDRDAAVEGFFGDGEQLGVAAGQADADIVVQHVDPAPALHGVVDHRLDLGIFGDVGLAGGGDALFLGDQVDRLLRGGEVVIDTQHLCAFAREGERGGAAVADAFARALAGADDDGDLVFQTHIN